MKTVGILGGLSPESTIKYYQWLNDGVRQHLGGHHSAKILLSSVDFGQFVALKEKGDWETQGRLLAAEAAALEKAGTAHEVQVFPGTEHGFQFVERSVYAPVAAEEAWDKLFALWERRLK